MYIKTFYKHYLILFLSSLLSCCSGYCEDEIVPVEDYPNYSRIIFQGRHACQSMVFHETSALFVNSTNDRLSVAIYNLSTRKKIDELNLPHGDYTVPHGNVTCFASNYNSANSLFPIMYVSAWNEGRQAFVYDIVEEDGIKAELIQVIDPNHVSDEIIGVGYLDWIVDVEHHYLYAIAYGLKNTSTQSTNNCTHITKFNLPSIKNKGTIYLENEDVIEHYVLPVMLVFQDKFYYNDHIYIAAGMPNGKNSYPIMLYDINTKEKTLKGTPIPLNEEPEGLCMYQNVIWLSTDNPTKIYNLNKLLQE